MVMFMFISYYFSSLYLFVQQYGSGMQVKNLDNSVLFDYNGIVRKKSNIRIY